MGFREGFVHHSAQNPPRSPNSPWLSPKAELLAARRGEEVKIGAVSNPADPDDALNSNGALLPGPHATLAGPTFAQKAGRHALTRSYALG